MMKRAVIAVSWAGFASAACDMWLVNADQTLALIKSQQVWADGNTAGFKEPTAAPSKSCTISNILAQDDECILSCNLDQQMVYYDSAQLGNGSNTVTSGNNEGYSQIKVTCNGSDEIVITTVKGDMIWNGSAINTTLGNKGDTGVAGSLACVPRTCNQQTDGYLGTAPGTCAGTENTTSDSTAACTNNCKSAAGGDPAYTNNGASNIELACVVDTAQTSNTGGNGAGLGLKWEPKTADQTCAVECALGLVGATVDSRIITEDAWSMTTGVKQPTGDSCTSKAGNLLRKGDSCELACNEAGNMLFYDSKAAQDGTATIASAQNEGFVKSTITCVVESNKAVVKMAVTATDTMWGGDAFSGTMTKGSAGGAGSLACVPRTCNTESQYFLGTAATQTTNCKGTSSTTGTNTCDQKCVEGGKNGTKDTIMLKCAVDATQTKQDGGDGAGLGLKWEANTANEQCKANCSLSLVGATADSRLITEDKFSTTTGVKEPTDAACTKDAVLSTGDMCSLVCNADTDMLYYNKMAKADGSETVTSGTNEGFVASKVSCEWKDGVATLMLKTDKGDMMWGGDAMSATPAKGSAGGAGSLACVKRTCNSPTADYLNADGTSCKGTAEGAECEDSCKKDFYNNGTSKIKISCKKDATSTTATGGNGAGLGVAWSPATANEKCSADPDSSSTISIASVALLLFYSLI